MESYELIRDAWRRACSPPDRRPIYEWAEQHVRLPTSGFTVTGPYHSDYSRHFLAIFESLQSETVRTVTLMKPTRGGGSMIADLWLPWVICNDAGPFQFNMQTDKIAQEHAETRTQAILTACPPVASLFHEDRHKTRKQEFIFSNGMPLWIQGPALSRLQSKAIRYQVNDELWEWPEGRHAHAIARTADFAEIQSSKVYNCSQGGFEFDPLDQAWKAGDQQEWEIVCLKCDHRMIPEWSNFREDKSRWGIVWDKHKRGDDYDRAKILESVRFECEKCGHPHSDTPRTRKEWNRLGAYRPTNHTAPPSLKSFHWTSIIHRSWSVIVGKWLDAIEALKRGDLELLQQFFQKEMARSWSEQLAFETSPIHEEAYEVKSKWDAEQFRFLTCDKQAEGLYYFVVRAWAGNGESRRLDHGKLYGYTEIDEKAKAWGVPPNRVFIDSGYETKEVYFHCTIYGWNATKGDGNRDHYLGKLRDGKTVRRSYSTFRGDPERGSPKQKRRFCLGILFAERTLQTRLQRLVDNKGATWATTPTGTEEEETDYKRQIASTYRRRVPDKTTGRTTEKWVCPSGANHLRDCEILQVLGAILAGVIED